MNEEILKTLINDLIKRGERLPASTKILDKVNKDEYEVIITKKKKLLEEQREVRGDYQIILGPSGSCKCCGR